jgi:hypothetical protein
MYNYIDSDPWRPAKASRGTGYGEQSPCLPFAKEPGRTCGKTCRSVTGTFYYQIKEVELALVDNSVQKRIEQDSYDLT